MPFVMQIPETFEELARLPDAEIDVSVGAALIAKDAYPALDVTRLLAALDDLAAPLAEAGLPAATALDQATRLAQYLFLDQAFRGNQADYYDPKNSYLPDVLARRLGIPITLGAIYVHVAARAGVEASGVCFPGHFLVRLERNVRAGEEPGALLVDPFFGGRVLSEEALHSMLERGGSEMDLLPEHTAPASPRAILVRMLVNLKAIHLSRGDYARAHLVLDRIVSLTPKSMNALAERALMAEKLGAHEAAIGDLSRVLDLGPDEERESAIHETLSRLAKKPRTLN